MTRQRRSSSGSASPAVSGPGAFLTDGRFVPEAGLAMRGHVDGLVRALVGQRRRGELSLQLASRAIMAGNATEAFPNVAAWELAEHWAMAPCSTAAEESVKREGRCADGHWCGQRWLAGRETDCKAEIHRMRPRRDEVAALLAGIAPGSSPPEDIPPPPE